MTILPGDTYVHARDPLRAWEVTAIGRGVAHLASGADVRAVALSTLRRRWTGWRREVEVRLLPYGCAA